MADSTPIHGRYVTLLQNPPHSVTSKGDAVDGFHWVRQYLYIDQVPEISRDSDTPYRIRMYDRQPTIPRQFQNYRTSLSIGDDLEIPVFPSLEHLFSTMVEWRPRPLPNSNVIKQSNLVLALITHGRRWVFNVADETELLELLDLFRSIAPNSCATADKRTRTSDQILHDLPVHSIQPGSSLPYSISEGGEKSSELVTSESGLAPNQLAVAASTTLPDSDGFSLVASSSVVNRDMVASASATPSRQSQYPSTHTPSQDDSRFSTLSATVKSPIPRNSRYNHRDDDHHSSRGNESTTEKSPHSQTSTQSTNTMVNDGDTSPRKTPSLGHNTSSSQPVSPLSANAEFNQQVSENNSFFQHDDVIPLSVSSQHDDVPSTPHKPSTADSNTIQHLQKSRTSDADKSDIILPQTKSDLIRSDSSQQQQPLIPLPDLLSNHFESIGSDNGPNITLHVNDNDEQRPIIKIQPPDTPSGLQRGIDLTHVDSTHSGSGGGDTGQDLSTWAHKSAVFHNLFGLPNDDFVVDFSCSCIKRIILHGRMYISSNHLCFYSSIFGYRTKIIIPLADIVTVEPTTVALVFGAAIKVVVNDEGRQPYVFGSFLNKDKVIAKLEDCAPHINAEERERVAKEEEKKRQLAAQQQSTGGNDGKSSTADKHNATDSSDDEDTTDGDDDDSHENVGSDDGDDDNGTTTTGEPTQDDSSSQQSSSDIPSWYPDSRPTLPLDLGFPPELTSPTTEIFKGIKLSEVVSNVDVKCSLGKFYAAFLHDYALSPYERYYGEVKGDQDIRVSQWIEKSPSTYDTINDEMYKDAIAVVQRDFALNTSLNSPMGPPRVNVHKIQILIAHGSNKDNITHLSMYCTSQTRDAPFGKSFTVCEQWKITPITTDGQHQTRCNLLMGVFFNEKPGFAMRLIVPTLISRVQAEGKQMHNAWLKYSNEYLDNNSNAIEPLPDSIFPLIAVKPSLKKNKTQSSSKKGRSGSSKRKHQVGSQSDAYPSPSSSVSHIDSHYPRNVPDQPPKPLGGYLAPIALSLSTLVFTVGYILGGTAGVQHATSIAILITLLCLLYRIDA